MGDDCPQWRLYCPEDVARLSGYAQELAAIASPVDVDAEDGSSSVLYWQRDATRTFDPLYGEPGQDAWRGPYSLTALVEFEDADGRYSNEPEEDGVERVYDGIMVVTVAEWNRVRNIVDGTLITPNEGDVINLFQGFRFFEIERVERVGYVLNSNFHTEWKCWLRKRDSFDPSRILPGA